MKCPSLTGRKNEHSCTVSSLRFSRRSSPEREDSGQQTVWLAPIPKVVGGVIAGRGARRVALRAESWRGWCLQLDASGRISSSARIFFSLCEHRTGQRTEMAWCAHGLRFWDVIDRRGDQPICVMPFYPGPGLRALASGRSVLSCPGRRGSTILRQTVFRTGPRSEHGDAPITSRCGGVGLNDRQKSLKGSRVLGAGVAYKKDGNDLGNRSSAEIIELLTRTRAPRSMTTTPYFR